MTTLSKSKDGKKVLPHNQRQHDAVAEEIDPEPADQGVHATAHLPRIGLTDRAAERIRAGIARACRGFIIEDYRAKRGSGITVTYQFLARCWADPVSERGAGMTIIAQNWMHSRMTASSRIKDSHPRFASGNCALSENRIRLLTRK